ncbi:hypothetical protein [Caulobacter sp. 17J65-9]|uniref:hypothetical protein n=1 Tax=Caulobacter sp. 17J65-9 TaxID=2709382 RepID=UPI0013C5AF2D|nr:hypothetical protein [Caulobacter sp. 17J65-9]NEX94558.1 hypothetical protein [Caulobacter sp. 17J65-9]
MSRILALAVASLVIAAATVAQAAEPAQPAPVRPLTVAEAAGLSDRQLADLVLAQLAERVAAVERPCVEHCNRGNALPPGPPRFGTVRLLMSPALAASNLCQADVITLRLDRTNPAAWPDLKRLPPHPLADANEIERTDPPVKAAVASMQTRYLALEAMSDVNARVACGNALRIDDYFTAPDERTAEAAVRTLFDLRHQAMAAAMPKFRLDCPGEASMCWASLGSLDPANLESVEAAPCPEIGGTASCLGLRLSDRSRGADTFLSLSVRTRRSTDGVLVIERVGLFWTSGPVV